MISVYDVQQAIQQPVSFCFEGHVCHERVVAGYEGERDVAMVGPLYLVSWMRVVSGCGHIHPRIYDARRLHEHDLLYELDAAYPDTRRRSAHAIENIRLYFRHGLPVILVVRV